MSLKCNEQIEHLERFLGAKSKSRVILKKLHRRWLRNQYKKTPEANLEKCFHGWEY
jgi:hypothetical protein